MRRKGVLALEVFLQQILNGITLGSIYGLVALGLTLVYGILHVPNFAHGALYMVEACAADVVMVEMGGSYWVDLELAAVVVDLFPVLFERLVFIPLRNAVSNYDMITAIGNMMFLEALVQMHWGAEFRRVPTPY